ncbi:virulence factor SrfB [Enterobacteriaceae bacterium ML5]|nr:virulence factor SrfB [Enterobacteriaceae bacterium ML5]
MLANLIDYQSAVTLMRDSSIQCLDFGLNPVTTDPHGGRFVRHSVNGPLLRLRHDPLSDRFTLPGENGREPEIVRPELTVGLEHSLQVLDGVWLPLPFMRFSPPRAFVNSPSNWARMQFKRLKTPDASGNVLRLCLAFDTKVQADEDSVAELALTERDIRDGIRFALAWKDHEVAEFMDNTWVDGWLREAFVQHATKQEERSTQSLNSALKVFEYQAHYLNILEMVGTQLSVPEIQIIAQTLNTPPVPVDLILDVGNTHTCGVILEDHGEKNVGLQQSAELHIRSLSEPHLISEPLFTSRLEFSEAKFGKHHFSMESGREDAFVWPSFARVGDEASGLAARRVGTEGTSGISSPRRYLWDDTPSARAWRFSQLSGKNPREPRAIALPLMNLMNDDGQPLYSLPEEERLPVFSPNYSRSSLMTIMLCELLAQALAQINSVSHRQSMGQTHAPRQLRHLVLTLPSAMPKPEREIFRLRVQEAVKLVWEALGWQPGEDNNCGSAASRLLTVPLPDVQMEWDEATCGQLVWLYNEVVNNYSGQAPIFFEGMARPDRQLASDELPGKTLRVASVDIGGGTTDMAITQYQLDDSAGRNVQITPQLLFREGFKIAGDDILLDVIRQCVLPALESALQAAGISETQRVMAKLFGESSADDNRVILRQQVTLQLFIPLGHAILACWENCDPGETSAHFEGHFGELLPHPPTPNVINYIQQVVQPLLPAGAPPFDVLDVPFCIELAALKDAMLAGNFSLTAPLLSLCEVLRHYCCDVLLVTGRPSGLPGVQALLRYQQPVPVNRIIWLDDYQLHERFPFGQAGQRVNPKSTAALGAMLCSLAKDLRLPGFNFKTSDIQAYSTLRFIGALGNSLVLDEKDVWYSDTDLDDPTARLDENVSFPLRGDACLGFRQLADARWPATPLYQLKITHPELAKRIAGDTVLRVRLQYCRQRGGFTLADVKMADGSPVPKEAVQLKLNTMAGSYNGIHHYWIDSGNVYLK